MEAAVECVHISSGMWHLMEGLMDHLTEVNEKQHAAEVSSVHRNSTACMVTTY